SWMNKKKKNEALLKGGCLYEYARESRRLRGLLVLMNPKRKREPFEIVPLPATGRAYNLPCSFEGLSEEGVRGVLGRALGWLARFAEELADNKSFAELLRRKGKEVERSLGRHRFDLPTRAIQLATNYVGINELPPWPWQPWSWNLFT